jgi:hypothetical protein
MVRLEARRGFRPTDRGLICAIGYVTQYAFKSFLAATNRSILLACDFCGLTRKPQNHRGALSDFAEDFGGSIVQAHNAFHDR